MSYTDYGKQVIWKHKEKGFLVWSTGNHLGDKFEGLICSMNEYYEPGKRSMWNKKDFERLCK
jgi:hypothetical protein